MASYYPTHYCVEELPAIRTLLGTLTITMKQKQKGSRDECYSRNEACWKREIDMGSNEDSADRNEAAKSKTNRALEGMKRATSRELNAKTD